MILFDKEGTAHEVVPVEEINALMRIHEHEFVEALKDIINMMFIYRKEIRSGSEIPDVVLGLIGGLKAINRQRKEPDAVINNFDIISKDIEYIMLFDYLDDNYKKEA